MVGCSVSPSSGSARRRTSCRGVAESLNDYYTGAGEALGRWAGIGAERLGLTGDVNVDDLRAVLAGIAPNTGGLSRTVRRSAPTLVGCRASI